MLWSLWSYRQDAFHHGSFGVQWIRASHMTGGFAGQPDQHRKGGLCRRQTHSTRLVVSSPASGIASTPTSLSGLENLRTPIPNPEARAIITNPLRTRATEGNQGQRLWQLQPQAVSTPRSVVSGSRSIHQFGHSDMMRLAFAMGRLLELYMWNRWLFMSASDLETVSCATRCIVKVLGEAPHW